MYTQAEATQALRDKFKSRRSRKALTVYTQVTHVSRSGMSRSIKFYIMRDNQPCELSWLMSKAGMGSIDQSNGGLRVGGCGMDMGFHMVYNMGWKLFNGTARHKRSRRDAGYILNQKWL